MGDSLFTGFWEFSYFLGEDEEMISLLPLVILSGFEAENVAPILNETNVYDGRDQK